MAWDKWIGGAVSVDTADRYRCSLLQIAPWLEGKALREIDGKLVAQIISERRKTGVSNATIKRDLGALSSVMKYAVLHDWCDHNPVLAKLALVPERRDPIVLPLQRDVDLVVSRIAATAPMIANLIIAATMTGAREAELVRAKRDHVDRERRQLTVIGKGNKLRVISLAPFGGFEFFTALPTRLKCPWLFWNRDGKPYSLSGFPGNFHMTVQETAAYAEANGIPFRPFTFHHLRHFHAVEFLKNGCGTIYDLQLRLGHTSVKTTEIYLQYLTAEEAQAAKFGRTRGI